MKHSRLQKLTSSYATLLPIAHHAFRHIDFGQHICQRREPSSRAKLHISIQHLKRESLPFFPLPEAGRNSILARGRLTLSDRPFKCTKPILD